MSILHRKLFIKTEGRVTMVMVTFWNCNEYFKVGKTCRSSISSVSWKQMGVSEHVPLNWKADFVLYLCGYLGGIYLRVTNYETAQNQVWLHTFKSKGKGADKGYTRCNFVTCTCIRK